MGFRLCLVVDGSGVIFWNALGARRSLTVLKKSSGVSEILGSYLAIAGLLNIKPSVFGYIPG